MYKVLEKANDDLISFCKCEEGAYASECQADCPWCGCGWLFTCVRCGMSFAFAKVIETEVSPQQVVQLEYSRRFEREFALDDDDVVEKAVWLNHEIMNLPRGTLCVFVDGKILPLNRINMEFDGRFAHHKFGILPQLAAHGSRSAIMKHLGNIHYWLERELQEEEKHDPR